jgi:signal transduction histidine kinase/ABC-type uncharacterized transport system substrate-binding protein
MRWLRRVWAGAALLVFAAVCATAAEPKRVLFLYSFSRDFQPEDTFAANLRTDLALRSPEPRDLYEVSLETARSSESQQEAPLIEYILALFAGRPPDLVVPMSGPAARFAQRYRQRLFPSTPMLFAAVDERLLRDPALTGNDAVVAVSFDVPGLIENILRVLPQTTTVAVVLGNSPLEKFWIEDLRQEFQPFTNRVHFEYFNQLSLEEMQKRAAELPPRSAILYGELDVDAQGVPHQQEEALARLSAVANAPIFGLYDYQLGRGILGGPLISVRDLSQETAKVAARILRGETPGNIKTPPLRPGTPEFDWRELRRWGVSETSLPPNSSVRFREPSLWERYSWYIALITAVFLVQAALISVLLREHRRRQVAEVQSRQRMAELAHVNRFSTAGQLTASIAHEINQPLGAILNNTETARAILTSPNPDISEVSQILGDILRDDRRAAEVIRRMHSLLKKAPFELKNLEFNDVVRDTVEFLSSLAVGRKVELTSSLTRHPLPILGDRIQLQQVILNLVVNGIDAMRDTRENRIISIRTSRIENFAELSVSDRGPGIPEDKLKEVFEPFFTSKAEGMGVGLSIARTIVEAHKGKIWAANRDGGGAWFRIRFPLVR